MKKNPVFGPFSVPREVTSDVRMNPSTKQALDHLAKKLATYQPPEKPPKKKVAKKPKRKGK